MFQTSFVNPEFIKSILDVRETEVRLITFCFENMVYNIFQFIVVVF